METYKHNYAIYIYGILLLAAIIPALLAVKHMGISPDSMMYALISQEIVSGNGIRLPILYSLMDNYVFVDGTIPFALEPPLFPILLALFGGVTSQSFLAAQLLNVIGHMAISIITFLLMKKIYNKSWLALLAGILVSTTFPILKVTHYILSDILCIAFTVAVIYFSVLSRDPGQYRFNRNLLIASIFTSLAILTRFAGVALMPVFFWQLFILLRTQRIKIKSTSVITTAILPLVTIGTLFIRTRVLSGSIHGWVPPPPERSYFEAVKGTIKMIFLQFDLEGRSVTLITIFVALFILFIVVNSNARREMSKHFHSGLNLIIIFIISHTLMVSYAMAKSQTVFELRYMSPLVPFLFILCIIFIVTAWETIRLKGFARLSLCMLILFLGMITLGNSYKTYMKSEEILSKWVGHYRILNSPTYHWLKKNYGNDVIITSNRPYHLSFFGDYTTIRLPHRRFNKNYRIPDNMEVFLPERMSKFGSSVLALFEAADEEYEGSYLAGLFSKRENDDNFVLIQKFSDGVVYGLRE